MDFYYINSNGRKIDLSKPPFLGLMNNDLFNYKWSYITQGQAVQKIVKFEKYMTKRNFEVVVSGNTDREYNNNLDRFLQLIDVDINNLKMGKLYVGDYYLECYIIQSGKPIKYLGTDMTKLRLTIVSERGNWQSEEMWRFRAGQTPGEGEDTGNGIIYPYDYPYDYAAPFAGDTIVNESYMDTDFEMVFYGPVEDPTVIVGGNTYSVLVNVQASELLKINSKNKTATLYKYNGETENVFMYRDREYDLFQKIKGGGNFVIVDDNVSFDITLFYERSEPKWGVDKWT